MKKNKHYYFCLSQGRTGTTFLTALFNENLPPISESHHEQLGFDTFGVETPNISTFMTFNTKGNVGEVKKFWKQKLTRISKKPVTHYAETSHLFMKAGLMENLDLLPASDKIHLIILRRDTMKVIQSYHNNFDFMGKGTMWMWFLDPFYPRKIVNPQPFAELGVFGDRLWYIYEIDARIEYYKMKLKKKKNVQFVEANIKDLNDKTKVAVFFKKLGIQKSKKDIIIPPKLNVSTKFTIHEQDIKDVKTFIKKHPFDAKKLAKQFALIGGNWD